MNLRPVFNKMKKYITPSQFINDKNLSTESSSVKQYCKQQLNWMNNKNQYDEIDKINIVSFNMLAPVYKRLSALDAFTGARKRESQFTDVWKLRANNTIQFIKNEILANNADIIGLQEFWLDKQYASLFEEVFKKLGYEMFLLQRSGVKADAVATIIRTSQFHILGSEDIYLCTIGDRVALLLWIQHKITGKHFLIANTHLSFPHNSIDKLNQIHQIKNLLDCMNKFAIVNQIDHVTRCIVGDFNVELTSPVCDHLHNMGYVSCFEISPPLNHHHTTTGEVEAKETEEAEKKCKKAAKKEFVSHRNHRQEEVGVDHIFIRPEQPPSSSSPSSSLSIAPSIPPVVMQCEGCPSTNPVHCQPKVWSEAHYPPHPETSITPAIELFITESAVLPRHIPCEHWDETFVISDHRPIVSQLIFAQAKETPTTTTISSTTTTSASTAET